MTLGALHLVTVGLSLHEMGSTRMRNAVRQGYGAPKRRSRYSSSRLDSMSSGMLGRKYMMFICTHSVADQSS